MSTVADDLAKVRDALIVLSGHLPLFSSDHYQVQRANKHLLLRDDAFDALDRLADALETSHVERRTLA